MEQFAPLLIEMFSEIALALAGLAVTWLSWKARKRFTPEAITTDMEATKRAADKGHRDALQSAMRNGIGKAMVEFGVTDPREVAADPVKRRRVIDYARKGAGEAIKHFSPLPDELDDLIIGKAGDMLSERFGR